jgi:hypothetical protein
MINNIARILHIARGTGRHNPEEFTLFISIVVLSRRLLPDQIIMNNKIQKKKPRIDFGA